jgi:hypothetical protein
MVSLPKLGTRQNLPISTIRYHHVPAIQLIFKPSIEVLDQIGIIGLQNSEKVNKQPFPYSEFNHMQEIHCK